MIFSKSGCDLIFIKGQFEQVSIGTLILLFLLVVNFVYFVSKLDLGVLTLKDMLGQDESIQAK